MKTPNTSPNTSSHSLEAYSVMVVYYAQMLSIFSDLSPEVYQSVCVSRSPKVDRKENKIQIEDISKVF